MKFKVGQTYTDIKGRRILVLITDSLYINGEKDYPIIGIEVDSGYAHYYRADGKSLSASDLIWPLPVRAQMLMHKYIDWRGGWILSYNPLSSTYLRHMAQRLEEAAQQDGEKVTGKRITIDYTIED